MNWCNCHYREDHLNNLSYIDVNSDNSVRCNLCGNNISKEDIIMLLLEETIKLKTIVEGLQFEKEQRDQIRYEEEAIRIEEEKIAEKEREKETERFEIMDL